MPTLAEFQKWQGEKPSTRTVDIDINKEGVTIWVYDAAIWAGQFVNSVAEINLDSEQERKEREQYERLRGKYAAAGE